MGRAALRGSSLVGAVCAISISLLAVLTIASSATLQVNLFRQGENAQIASLLADSAIQRGIAELMADSSWGTHRTRDGFHIDGPIPNSGVDLNFNPSSGQPFSTNNQTGSSPLGWSASRLLTARTVPAERVHLVAVAHCGNLRKIREAVIEVPDFTLSLGATGKVHLHSSLVGSLENPADLARVDGDPSILGPGDLATNSDRADSVELESNSHVLGNLQSRGNINVAGDSRVGGEIRRFHSQTEFPHFQFDDYDPAKDGALVYETLAPGPSLPRRMTGLVRCAGSCLIDGNLDLDNAILFVTGDLTVRGSLSGTGAVIVKGNTRIQRGSSLTSEDQVALLSRGDIFLDGVVGADYTFKGLVYTRGNFTARNFTVVGGFIADGDSAGNGNVDLHGCRAIHLNNQMQVDIYYPNQMVLQVASAVNEPVFRRLPIAGDGSFIEFGQTPVLRHPRPPDNVASYANPSGGAVFSDPDAWDWWNPVFLQISQEGTQLIYTLLYKEAGTQVNERYANRDQIIDRLCQLAAINCPSYNDGINQGDRNRPYPVETSGPFAGLRKETTPYRRRAYELIFPTWEQKNARRAPSGASYNFSFDPNRFLRQVDKIRISAVTEY
jgi:hypothetical protein